MRWFVLALAAAGCVTGFHEMRDTLPEVESRAFDACYAYLRACPAGGDSAGFERSACMGQVAEQYARLPSRASRRTLLVEAGCPTAIVDGVLATAP